MPSPVSSETRAQIIKLHGEGNGRNAIARLVGVAPSLVSKICGQQDPPLTFDRSASEVAVRARTIDLAESRLELAQKLMVTAHDVIDDLEQPFLVFNFGGKDNTYIEHLLDSPPLSARREAVTIAGIAIDKATRILEKTNSGLDGTVGMLDDLADVLKKAADAVRDETPAEPTVS